MRPIQRFILAAVWLGLLLGVGGCAAPPSSESRPDPLLSATQLPELQGGKPVALSEWVSPRGLLLVFVDPTCPFAEQTLTELPKVTAALNPHHLPTLVVNLDQPLAEMRTYYDRKKLGVRVVYDSTHATWQRWRLEQVPTLVLVDRAGKVAYRGNGEWDKLKPAIAQQLALNVRDLNFGAKGTEDG